jgi:hypothetical protein
MKRILIITILLAVTVSAQVYEWDSKYSTNQELIKQSAAEETFLRFNGVDNRLSDSEAFTMYITMGYTFTATFAVNPDIVKSDATYTIINNPFSAGIYYRKTSGGIKVFSVARSSGGTFVPTDSLHYAGYDKISVAMVLDESDSTMYLYQNGELFSSASYSAFSEFAQTNAIIDIGYGAITGSQTYGVVDMYEASVYDRALDASEVEGIYKNGFLNNASSISYADRWSDNDTLYVTTFDASTGWTLGGNWTIQGDTLGTTADSTSQTAYYTLAGKNNKWYRLYYECTYNTLNGGGLTLFAAPNYLWGSDIATLEGAPGTKTDTIIYYFKSSQTGTATLIGFSVGAGNTSGTVSIDSLALSEVGCMFAYAFETGYGTIVHDESDNDNDLDIDGTITEVWQKTWLHEKVGEIYRHFHNTEYWFGKGFTDGYAKADSLNEWTLTTGAADTFGDSVRLFNGDEVSELNSNAKEINIHEVFVTAVSQSDANYLIELLYSSDGTWANRKRITTLPFRAASTFAESLPIEVVAPQIPADAVIWARALCTDNASKTIDIIVGLHVYSY